MEYEDTGPSSYTPNQEEVSKRAALAERKGFLDAVEMFRTFGDDLPPDKALSDEERYILAQACEIIEDQAPPKGAA